MAKKPSNPLQAALERASDEQDNSARGDLASAPLEQAEPARRRPGRKNTVLIGGHFPPAVRQQLRIIAAEEDRQVNELLAEALNLLFVKKGKDAIDL